MTVKTHEPPLAMREGLLFAVNRTPGRAPPNGATVQLPQADEPLVYAAVNVAFGWYMQTDRSAAPVRLESVKASESGVVAEATTDGDVVTTREPIVPEAVAVLEVIAAGEVAEAEAWNVNVEPVAPVIRYLHRKDAVAPTASEEKVVGVGPERSVLPPGAVIVGVILPSVVDIPPFVTSSRTTVSPPEMTDAGSSESEAVSAAIVTVGDETSIDVAVAPFCARPRK